MGGIFSKPKAQTYTPPPPTAPVEEATFEVGGSNTNDTKKKNVKLGKKRLQIPTSTTTATTGTGVGTGV